MAEDRLKTLHGKARSLPTTNQPLPHRRGGEEERGSDGSAAGADSCGRAGRCAGQAGSDRLRGGLAGGLRVRARMGERRWWRLRRRRLAGAHQHRGPLEPGDFTRPRPEGDQELVRGPLHRQDVRVVVPEKGGSLLVRHIAERARECLRAPVRR
ncbi:hypothetical protein T492DRAFT_1091344, partial [Pavlovales sp. CCMP2436]